MSRLEDLIKYLIVINMKDVKQKTLMLLLISSTSISAATIIISKISLNTNMAMLCRNFLGLLFTLPLILFRKNNKNLNIETTTGNSNKKLLKLLCYSFISFISGVLFVYSLKTTSVTHVMFISALSPMAVLFLESLTGKKIKNYQVVGMVIAIMGILLLISQKNTNSQVSILGDLMAGLCTLICIFSSKLVSNLRVKENASSASIMFYGDLLCFGFFLVKTIFASDLEFNLTQFFFVVLWTMLMKFGWGLIAHISAFAEQYQLQLGSILTPIVGTVMAVIIGLQNFSTNLLVSIVFISVGILVSEKIINISKIFSSLSFSFNQLEYAKEFNFSSKKIVKMAV